MPPEPQSAREPKNPKEPSALPVCCGCVLKVCCCCIYCVLLPGIFLGWKFFLCPAFQNVDPNDAMKEIQNPTAGQVVFIGDGNVDWWDGSTTSDLQLCDNCGGADGWAQVESIFPGMKIYNIGVDKSTINQWLDEKAVSNMLTKFKPQTVVMHMGMGDIVTGGGCDWFPLKFEGESAEDTNTALSKVFTLLKAGGVSKVYYLSATYGDTLKDHFKEFEKYDSLAKTAITNYQSTQFVYIDAATGLPGGSYGNDGIHLTSTAYTKWQAWLQAAATDQTCAIWSNGVCASSGATSGAVTSQTSTVASGGTATTDTATSGIAAPVGAAATSTAATDAVVSPTGGDETAADTATSAQDNNAIFGVSETSAAATPRLI